MAGVKTQKSTGGPKVETRFAPVSCYICQHVIDGLKEGVNVLRIESRHGRRKPRYGWAHKKCLGADAPAKR
jgi:hypothetical protein